MFDKNIYLFIVAFFDRKKKIISETTQYSPRNIYIPFVRFVIMGGSRIVSNISLLLVEFELFFLKQLKTYFSIF